MKDSCNYSVNVRGEGIVYGTDALLLKHAFLPEIRKTESVKDGSRSRNFVDKALCQWADSESLSVC